MRGWFSLEGPVIAALTKIGELILLTVIWIFCCLPVITIVSATSSFYYAVVKSIRMQEGYFLKEYFANLKRTFGRGIGLGLLMAAWFFLAGFSYYYYTKTGETGAYFVKLADIALILIGAGVWLYLSAVLSRFEKPAGKLLSMSVFLSFRFLPRTILIEGSLALVVWLGLFVLPKPLFVLWPGAYMLLLTYLMEKPLHLFMPPPVPGEEKWYDKTCTDYLSEN